MLNLPSNLSTNFFAFSKFSFFSQVSYSAVNPFYLTKYLSTPFIFLLFKIFSTSHSSTSFTSIGFTSFFFYPSTCSLYCTTQLIFTTRWILIKIGSHNLTILVDTTSSIMYRLIYWSTSFFASLSLNTKSFVLNITLSLFFYSLLSFLSLSACLFISFCIFFNSTPTSFYTFFILSTNSITFSTFSFFLMSASILNSLL